MPLDRFLHRQLFMAGWLWKVSPKPYVPCVANRVGGVSAVGAVGQHTVGHVPREFLRASCAAQTMMSSLCLHQGRERPVVEALARWVADEFRDKRNCEVDTSSWPRCYETDIPQQLNGSDCGVFALQVGGRCGLSSFGLRFLVPMASRGSTPPQWHHLL